MTPPVLDLSGTYKRFGGVVAQEGAEFVRRAGMVHALLGENAAA